MLTLKEKENSNKVKRFKCRVVELGPSTLFLDYPIDLKTNRTAFFPNGTEIIAKFNHEDQTIYQFELSVVGRKKDNIPMLITQYDENKFKKLQRREFVRVDCHLDVIISDITKETDVFETVTRDISGGGIAIYLPNDIKLNKESQFHLSIQIPSSNEQDQMVYTNAEIVRISTLDHGEESTISLEYTDISERDRQRIIQFCFETQLRNHKHNK